MNPKSSASAELNQDLIERYFMEEYHWTPMQISQLPYKWVQRYFIINKYKGAAIDTKRQIDEFKKQHQAPSKHGGLKKFKR
jgi:hypothetical protein